ncbi:hypothetical protein EY643_03780 [Halioglobus maricola]|uniref:Prepilin-type N-terminal cleavage/methylation domain-containing protein n=1 Tax=Halioglobus maricola TaxID=2601894 RepID=A0A5P9NI12_9GAMM|nr:hypothetical protein [Halioglobus maricola]QFU74834.1 hypothetical protein EY643_03780 [Halioglobus maricola]
MKREWIEVPLKDQVAGLEKQHGAGLLEVTVALLLVSIASLGLSRGQLLAREMGHAAQRHEQAIQVLQSLLEVKRANSGALNADLLPGALNCVDSAAGEIRIRIAWPPVSSLSETSLACADPLPDGWSQLQLQTRVGEGW